MNQVLIKRNSSASHISKKPLLNERTALKEPSKIPNAATLGSGCALPELEEAMQQRIYKHFAGHQIPAAENEADRLAAEINPGSSPETVKEAMGEKLSADFSGVSFHTDLSTEETAANIGARAYTTGSDIYFGSGGFDPVVAAHELVHTVQQGAVDSPVNTESAPSGEVQMTKVGAYLREKFGKKRSSDPAVQADALRRARAGDVSQMASVAKPDYEQLIQNRMAAIQPAAGVAETPAQIKARLLPDATAALDPVTRNAMSRIAKSDPAFQSYGDAAELADREMIEKTMMIPRVSQWDRVYRHFNKSNDQRRLLREFRHNMQGKAELGDDGGYDGYHEARSHLKYNPIRSHAKTVDMRQDAMSQAQKSGDVLLRSLFLMQLGQFNQTDKVDGHKIVTPYSGTMASAFSHGARTGFQFGAAPDAANSSDAVISALFGANPQAAGIHERSAGTHFIKRADADSTDFFKEKSGVWAAMSAGTHSDYTHYGMDMAIGGIGTAGAMGRHGGQTIMPDGRSGHMYMGVHKADRGHKGGLLMGLESDSPYRMNQTGHMHDAAATPEEGSSTGGLKVDLRGEKYGGRSVDLSGLQNSETADLLNQFTVMTDQLRQTNPDGYEALVKKMSGEQMSPRRLKRFLKKHMQVGRLPGERRRDYNARIEDMVKRARKLP